MLVTYKRDQNFEKLVGSKILNIIHISAFVFFFAIATDFLGGFGLNTLVQEVNGGRMPIHSTAEFYWDSNEHYVAVTDPNDAALPLLIDRYVLDLRDMNQADRQLVTIVLFDLLHSRHDGQDYDVIFYSLGDFLYFVGGIVWRACSLIILFLLPYVIFRRVQYGFGSMTLV